MRARSPTLHRQRFGYVDETGEIVVDALIVEAVAHTGTEASFSRSPGGGAESARLRGWTVFAREQIVSEQRVDGPR